MIENSMFYMDFEISSEQQRECIEKIKENKCSILWSDK